MKNKIIRMVMTILVLLILVSTIVIVGLYIGNSSTRNWIDKNILRKDIGEEKLATIEIEENENVFVHAYKNHIATVSDNKLTIYNAGGRVEETINVSITSPKFASCGEYLLVADEGKSNIYLIYNTNLQWERELEGSISQITVNKNGAVGVALEGTIYKTVIVMYDITGNENFKTYLSSTVATDITISDDGQFLSFAEINTSGTAIESKVKTISVEKTKDTPNEAIVNTYELENDRLVLKIKYRKNKIVVFTDKEVYLFSEGEQEKILDVSKDTSFLDINLNAHICRIKENNNEKEAGKYEVEILDVDNKKTSTYILKDTVKSMYCKESVIALNLGNEIEFLNMNGWLIKKYNSIQNIKDISISENIAAVIYKNRIAIVEL